jgi:phosphoglycolate phosphatase
MLAVYRANIAQHTRLFPGMDAVLDTIEARGMNWGVVTNKPAWLTEPLLEQLDLTHRAASIVSGDSTAHKKPHPAPMLLACTQTGSDAPQCLYVGDAQRDIEAGRNAGMTTLVALFGYIGDDDRPESWGADGLVNAPREILDWI